MPAERKQPDHRVLLWAGDGPESIEVYTSESEGVTDWAPNLPALYICVTLQGAQVKLGPFTMKSIREQFEEIAAMQNRNEPCNVMDVFGNKCTLPFGHGGYHVVTGTKSGSGIEPNPEPARELPMRKFGEFGRQRRNESDQQVDQNQERDHSKNDLGNILERIGHRNQIDESQSHPENQSNDQQPNEETN